MIDEPESHLDPRDHAGDAHYAESLLYDLAKFVTTLSLLSIGGVLTLTQAASRGAYPPTWLAFALSAIAFAGLCSFGTAYSLADARTRGREPSPRLGLLLQIATALLGIGTGSFVWMWWRTLA